MPFLESLPPAPKPSVHGSCRLCLQPPVPQVLCQSRSITGGRLQRASLPECLFLHCPHKILPSQHSPSEKIEATLPFRPCGFCLACLCSSVIGSITQDSSYLPAVFAFCGIPVSFTTTLTSSMQSLTISSITSVAINQKLVFVFFMELFTL